MNILIAPAGFKEGLGPEAVADWIEEGVLRVLPKAHIVKIPLVDGGEGFATALTNVTGGKIYRSEVTGPVGEPVVACWGILGGTGPKTAIMEMASAAGLRLVPEHLRNPLKTTTYGVGELIGHALDAGVERILIGCGDSATTDGGAGMAQALGVRLLDPHGRDIGLGGAALLDLARIDGSRLDSRIANVQIDVACNFNSLLCGLHGAARMFGPQKGATPADVETLVTALEHFAAVIRRQLGLDVRTRPGSGAAGGLGAGLNVFLGAKLYHRYEIVMRYLEIDQPIRQADLVITAEGCIDASTARGKIPCEVARRAQEFNIPTVALVGTVGIGAERTLSQGLDAYSCILDSPMTRSMAIGRTGELLAQGAENFMRALLVGNKLAKNMHRTSDQFEDAPLSQTLQVDQPMSETPMFMDQLSLDMRTPLNLVIAYAKMIKDGLLGETNLAQKRALTQAIKHSYWMLSIVNSLTHAIVGTRAENLRETARSLDS
jgi:glycerate 2-kinase